MSGIIRYTSVREVMARIIDDVGGRLPSHYMDSMLEWIPQGIRMLETKYQLITMSTPSCGENGQLCTKNHVSPLPTGIYELIAVEDQFGERVREGSDITDFQNQSNRYSTGQGGNDDARPTTFQVDPSVFPPVPWDGEDLAQVTGVQRPKWSYKIQGNMIQTSEESMFIKLHYLGYQTDSEGFWLVPDIEEYKQALQMFIIRQLCGAGFQHPMFPKGQGYRGWRHFDEQWEKMAGRALGVVKYPTLDRMEKLRVLAERLIPPRHFYDDFFVGAEQTQSIAGI